MARVTVEEALERIERPVEPRPEFGEALLRRLLAELEERPQAVVAPRPRRVWSRRYLLAAAALAVLAALIGTVLLTRPSEASAAEVIAEAQEDFAEIPPFRATIGYELNPEGGYFAPGVPQGATAVIEISYRGASGFRQEIVEMDPILSGTGGPGSFIVWDGERSGEYRADSNTFGRTFGADLFREPLRELSWNAPYPNWEDICSRAGSEVLPDAEIAGRPARHVRCGDFKGGFWELWLDRETGLVLKIVGELGRDDFRLGTSPAGGFEVTSIEYNPTFAAGTFNVVGPPGAKDVLGKQETAFAKVPAFRATYSRTLSRERVAAENPDYEGSDWVYVDTVWYRGESAWRREVLEDSLPEFRGGLGAGGFAVWEGEQMGVFYPQSNTYSLTSEADLALHPLSQLVPEADAAYDPARCDPAGEDTIAERRARHFRCHFQTAGDRLVDVWLDAETGLYLKLSAPDFGLEVRSIEYDPTFPPETFKFVPPAGARDVEEVAADPYTHTTLRPGQIAPVWSAKLLGGGSFDLEQARGRPLLVFFWADWCDKACFSSFPAFQEVSEQWADRVGFVSVDFQGLAEEARKIMRNAGYTFSVVDDKGGEVGKVWGVKAVPLWVLLDAEGRVIEVRIKPQSVAQLNDLLAKAEK